MGSVDRRVGFLASVASASIFYVVWFTLSLGFGRPRDVHSVLFDLGFVIFFWALNGLAAALVLMALVWYIIVRMYARLRRLGQLYFSLSGAVTLLVLSCATSSLSPKPLFVEDQSFLEGFMITAQRQGMLLLLTGFVFGLTFWLVSERLRHPRGESASRSPDT